MNGIPLNIGNCENPAKALWDKLQAVIDEAENQCIKRLRLRINPEIEKKDLRFRGMYTTDYYDTSNLSFKPRFVILFNYQGKQYHIKATEEGDFEENSTEEKLCIL